MLTAFHASPSAHCGKPSQIYYALEHALRSIHFNYDGSILLESSAAVLIPLMGQTPTTPPFNLSPPSLHASKIPWYSRPFGMYLLDLQFHSFGVRRVVDRCDLTKNSSQRTYTSIGDAVTAPECIIQGRRSRPKLGKRSRLKPPKL